MEELEMAESEKARLEALFLRLELLNRDIQKILQEAETIRKEIAQAIQYLARKQGLSDQVEFIPEFNAYELKRIVIKPSSTTKNSQEMS